jgi:hydrogenase maturation protein HypF
VNLRRLAILRFVRVLWDLGVAIPLDTALCPACEAEMDDPSNRRYRYPFINCTDCGPRYTIIQTPPYDRVRTSMKHFTMCSECLEEYNDPTSRRYHAEPISCPQCGPKLRFLIISERDRLETLSILPSKCSKREKSSPSKGWGDFI